MAGNRRKRIPQLRYTDNRGIGWHVSFRDPQTGTPKKHRFNAGDENQAQQLYHEWLAKYLKGDTADPSVPRPMRKRTARPVVGETLDKVASKKQVRAGSLLEVASGLLKQEKSRTREHGAVRTKGTISPFVLSDRTKHIRNFLAHINSRYGAGASGRICVSDLTMEDVESYNRAIAIAGYSDSQVNKRMQMVKAIVDRAGRPEHGQQRLAWNWESRDVVHGLPAKTRELPTVKQLQAMLVASGVREQAILWTAIGLGFGQRDLSVLRVGQIDAQSYDLRRAKTGVERYGSTPPLVWAYLKTHITAESLQPGDLLFTTRAGKPLVHGTCDSIQQWWHKLRLRIGESSKTMSGFYVLRHLGATEFGSRKSCSLSDMRRWLGHTASSRMADLYMRPVSPEDKAVVEWVRRCLKSKNRKIWVPPTKTVTRGR